MKEIKIQNTSLLLPYMIIFLDNIFTINSVTRLIIKVIITAIGLCNDKAIYPVGGGIVWDSIATKEWDEAQLKSKILDTLVI